MLDWGAIWGAITGVFELLLSPAVSTCWCYLLTAAVIATVVYVVRDASSAGPTVRGWLRYLLPRKIFASRTFVDDLTLFFVGSLIYSFWLFGPLQALLSWTAGAVSSGLQAHFQPPGAGNGVVARSLVTFAGVVVADLAFFLAHLAQHRLPILWEFHKTHHSAEVLEPFATFRRHPVDIILEGAVSAIFAGALYGSLIFVCGEEISPIRSFGVNVLLGAYLLAGFCLQHSHVWLTFGPLDRFLISPAAHQIHHSRAVNHLDRNFGNMLSIWDRLFGTYVRPRGRERLMFGLDDGTTHRGLFQLYLGPVRGALMLVLTRLRGHHRPS